MAINFPSSPTDGQKFTQGTVVYTYSTATGAWNAAPLGTALPFNYLVNPSFLITQQNAPATQSTAASFYAADQWFSAPSPVGPLRFDRLGSPSFMGSPVQWRNQVVAAKASFAASEYAIGPMQYVEGNRIAAFQWGTAAAKPVVLRFYCSGVSGIYAVGIRNGLTNNRCYIIPFTVTEAPSVTKEFVFAIPGDTTGTWNKDSTAAFSILWNWGTGTTNATATSNTWLAGGLFGSTTQTNGCDTNGNIFTVQDVGLYLDPNNTGKAPPWEAVDEKTAMMDSQRYWQKCMSLQGMVSSTATTYGRGGMPLAVPIRIGSAAITKVGNPTFYDQATNNAIATISLTSVSTLQCEINGTGTMTASRAAVMVGSDVNYLPINARM